MDFLELNEDFFQSAYPEGYLEKEHLMSQKEKAYLQQIKNHIHQQVSPEIYNKYYDLMILSICSGKDFNNMIMIEVSGGEVLAYVNSHQHLIIQALQESNIPYDKLHITWYHKEYVPFKV